MIRLNTILAVATPLILGLSAALSPVLANAESCTDGVDCYCDRVRNPADALYDPNLLMCEDWEARTLHDDVDRGAGGDTYGPWYDDTGYAGARGSNSYWVKHYKSSVSNCAWGRSSPQPTLGNACTYDTCFAGEWSAGDPWTANQFACLDIVRNGEFDDELPGLSAPLLSDNTRGVFGGQQVMGFRVGAGKTAGITGTANFGRTVTELGITMALAYSENSYRSGVWNHPWKHDEMLDQDGRISEHWNLGRTGTAGADQYPYSPFLFNTGQSACETALSRATVSVGRADCTSVALRLGADPNAYSQPTDFPWGTWGCHRSHIKGLGTSNVSVSIWHNDVLVFAMTGFDGNALRSKGFRGMNWNHYSNANQSVGGEVATRETTYRYEDNVHYREGVPVSCQAIGFGDLAAPPTPTAPPSGILAPPVLLP